jgi:hypothetical protein
MSLFGKDSQKRITDTLAFIEGIQGIDVGQKNKFISANRYNIQISPKISLGFTLVNNTAETERRRALRALLLCVGTLDESVINEAKLYFKNKPVDDLIDGIKSYFPLAGSGEDSVVKIITEGKFTPQIGESFTVNQFYKYTRKALLRNEVRGCGNCYGGACLFLYLGGVVSLRWLRLWNTQAKIKAKGPEPPEHLFSFGFKISVPEVAEDIAKGKLLYYCRPYGGVHYAISIGNGKCVGHNNSEVSKNWPKGDDKDKPPITTCSTFKIASYLKACQNELLNANHLASESFIRFASCVPTAGF